MLGALGKFRGKTFIFFKVEYDGVISTSENCDFLWKRFTEHTPEIWGVQSRKTDKPPLKFFISKLAVFRIHLKHESFQAATFRDFSRCNKFTERSFQ